MYYKVIKILDKKTLLINYGLIDGAKKGEKLKIIERGTDIYDLDNKFIGTLDLLKVEVEIIRTEEEFSLCQNIELKEHNPFTSLDLFNKKINHINDLTVEEKDIENIKYITSEPIKINDDVKKSL